MHQWLIVFSERDGRWLVDELTGAGTSPGLIADLDDVMDRLGTPAVRRDVQHLEVGLWDGGAMWWGTQPLDNFAAGDPVLVTVANLGNQPHRFVIPALRLTLAIEAGHSAQFEVLASAGEYTLASYVPDSAEQPTQRLDAVLVLSDNPDPTRG